MKTHAFVTLASALLFTSLAVAEPPRDAPTPLISQPGALLFLDEFNVMKPVWNSGKGDWKFEEGIARGAERAADHHKAGLAHNVKFRDGVIRLVFKFDGAKAIEAALIKTNDAKEREHVARISFGLDSIKLYAQTGMGLTTKNNLIADKPVKFVAGKWHTALIEFVGGELVVQVDTGEVARGKDELLNVDKSSLSLSVAGKAGVFDDLKL